MKKRLLAMEILLLSALILAACTGGADLREVADIVSPTLTAIAQQGDAPPAAVDSEPPPEETEPPGPPEPPNRCDLFDPEQNTFVIHTISWGDESFVMYIKLPGDVPGLVMPVDGDDAPWIYEASIGGLESIGCKTYEGEIYRNRIYCVFPIDNSYYNTAQLFELWVNGCDTPIAGHPRLSLVVPEPEEEEEGLSLFIPVCVQPTPQVCGSAYESYCDCLGMNYYCHNLGWGITYPACYPASP